MDQSSIQPHHPLVTEGTKSWEKPGVDADHELLTEFLEEVAATETIQSASTVAVERMRLQSGASAIDVGCGTGVFFPVLAEAIGPKGKLTGLDHGAGFLAEARERSDSGGFGSLVTLVIGDAHFLPFPDDSFDAAHTERVLMHLIDPDTALREMQRVVRPGGWMVCVEPDLRGMRVDHPDAYRMGKILSGFCETIRFPAMGLELNRRMAGAGLVARSIDVLTEVSHDYDAASAEFFSHAADLATANGWISKVDAAQTLAELQQAAAEGIYTSYATMFVVAGQVPER